jgi:hypothetical protein
MRVYRPLSIDHEQAEAMRQLARECREVLKLPMPDTFLGRKTRAAPREEDASRRDAADDEGAI